MNNTTVAKLTNNRKDPILGFGKEPLGSPSLPFEELTGSMILGKVDISIRTQMPRPQQNSRKAVQFE
jgi:hypothetical protein